MIDTGIAGVDFDMEYGRKRIRRRRRRRSKRRRRRRERGSRRKKRRWRISMWHMQSKLLSTVENCWGAPLSSVSMYQINEILNFTVVIPFSLKSENALLFSKLGS